MIERKIKIVKENKVSENLSLVLGNSGGYYIKHSQNLIGYLEKAMFLLFLYEEDKIDFDLIKKEEKVENLEALMNKIENLHDFVREFGNDMPVLKTEEMFAKI